MQSYKVEFSQEAKKDLFHLYEHTAYYDAITAAEKIIDALSSTCKKLSTLSKRGHTVKELEKINIFDYLEIPHKPYRILYRVSKSHVMVTAILDGRRNLRETLQLRFLKKIPQ